jgi:hypothetical protein
MISQRPTKLERAARELERIEKKIEQNIKENAVPIVDLPKKTDEKTWISLGDRQFHIEDIHQTILKQHAEIARKRSEIKKH